MTIVDCVDEWACCEPNRTLYRFLDGRGRQTELYDYSGFARRTRSLAWHLEEGIGIKRGDRVLLVYPPGLEAIVAFLACARIGAIPVPVTTPSRRDYRTGLGRLLFVARDCEAETVLTTQLLRKEQGSMIGSLEVDGGSPSSGPSGGRLRWCSTDDLGGATSEWDGGSPGEILFLQYTSGSTSTPKGVVVTHQNVIENGLATLGTLAVGKVGVSWLPQYHDMGLIGYYLYPLVVGGTTHGFPPIDFLRRPSLWLQTISRVGASFSSSPNFGFEYCLNEEKLPDSELEGVDLSSLESLMNAAEPVRADTYARFLRRFAPYGLHSSAHVVAYGLAENTLAVTHRGRRTVTLNGRDRAIDATGMRNGKGNSLAHREVMSCGRPVSGVDVRVVDPDSRLALGPRKTGEIWVTGRSKCPGYWGRPDLSKETFENRIANVPAAAGTYLRTGDLGFLDAGELFVCGRSKDLIIVRGVNYHPQDIERVVETASTKIRAGGVVAFAGEGDEESIVVVVEVRDPAELVDPALIVQALRLHSFVGPFTIVLVRSKTIDRTSSGKLARSLTRRRWLEGELNDLLTYSSSRQEAAPNRSLPFREHLWELLDSYNLRGREHLTLEEAGIDSLDLVMVVEEIEQLLVARAGKVRLPEIDGRLLQRLTVTQLLSILDLIEGAAHDPEPLEGILHQLKDDQDESEAQAMRRDATLGKVTLAVSQEPRERSPILLTGPTGFFGPFLLASLLQSTRHSYCALTRAASPEHGLERIKSALCESKLMWPTMEQDLDSRLRIVCGDMSRPNLGLGDREWMELARSVQAVVHNAALVNYSMNYSALKPHNVGGTRELLRLALFAGRIPFHFISSTIIFGWTPKARLFEDDNNDEMLNLDFGYAQTKWVAEQLVLEAAERGLPIQIYRPSFVSASSQGVASPADITVRLLAFMINHGLGVNARNQISFLPADIAAHNIARLVGHDGRSAGPTGVSQPTTFHVTVDDFYSIVDLTKVITLEHGHPFVYYDIPEFVSELKRRCERDDPLYPLLDFVTRSYLKIERMEHKRYDNRQYRLARETAEGLPDPTLSQTVAYLMRYLTEAGLLSRRARPARTVLEPAGA